MEDQLYVGDMCYASGIFCSVFPISMRVFYFMVEYEKSYDIVIFKRLAVRRMDT